MLRDSIMILIMLNAIKAAINLVLKFMNKAPEDGSMLKKSIDSMGIVCVVLVFSFLFDNGDGWTLGGEENFLEKIPLGLLTAETIMFILETSIAEYKDEEGNLDYSKMFSTWYEPIELGNRAFLVYWMVVLSNPIGETTSLESPWNYCMMLSSFLYGFFSFKEYLSTVEMMIALGLTGAYCGGAYYLATQGE